MQTVGRIVGRTRKVFGIVPAIFRILEFQAETRRRSTGFQAAKLNFIAVRIDSGLAPTKHLNSFVAVYRPDCFQSLPPKQGKRVVDLRPNRTTANYRDDFGWEDNLLKCPDAASGSGVHKEIVVISRTGDGSPVVERAAVFTGKANISAVA